MKRLIVFLILLILLPIAVAQTMDYDFFTNSGELYSLDSGLVYVYMPSETLEKTNLTFGAMFFPKTGFSGNLILENELGELEGTFFTNDDAPGNKSYLVFNWDLFVDKNTTLVWKIKSEDQTIYENEFLVHAKERILLDRQFSEKTIEINSDLPEDIFSLRDKLSIKGYDITEEEFETFFKTAQTLEITKNVETEKLIYEGDLIITKTKTTFNLGDLDNTILYIIESIDKSVATNASEISYSQKPIILEEDPLIMWHVEETQTQEISYEIEKESDVGGELTGNTILLASTVENNSSDNFFKTILPLLLIPLIVLIIIYFGTVNLRKKK